MRALEFVEVPEFTRDLHRVGDDQTLQALQLELLRDPAKGDLMRGTGGLRKVRLKLPGRGKTSAGGTNRTSVCHAQREPRLNSTRRN